MKNLVSKLWSKSKMVSLRMKIIIGSICLVTISVAIFFVFHQSTEESLYGKIRNTKELSAIELSYPGIVTYTDGSIPFLTKKSFDMEYEATTRFGIKDMSNVKLYNGLFKITVVMPHTEKLDDIAINEESMRLITKDRALLNWSDPEDCKLAMNLAKEQAESDIDSKYSLDQVIHDADEKAEEIIKDLLGQTGKTVVVCFE